MPEALYASGRNYTQLAGLLLVHVACADPTHVMPPLLSFLHSVYTVKDDIVAKHKCNHCYGKLLVDVLQLIRYFWCSGFNGESSLYSGSLP